ncbi:hypothetical protein MUK42_37473 [Musa troglodytarum]|uniref:Uncharacterized protein n=1 Tax=Musa troglodytarum TaxID=320322 RepID=A0A9E7J981_9LILI|nr:hypothetical protein MUK42_37473 [Musa troglodytarum]
MAFHKTGLVWGILEKRSWVSPMENGVRGGNIPSLRDVRHAEGVPGDATSNTLMVEQVHTNQHR